MALWPIRELGYAVQGWPVGTRQVPRRECVRTGASRRFVEMPPVRRRRRAVR